MLLSLAELHETMMAFSHITPKPPWTFKIAVNYHVTFIFVENSVMVTYFTLLFLFEVKGLRIIPLHSIKKILMKQGTYIW